MGASPSTKYVIPLELTDLARRLGNFLDSGLESGASVRIGLQGQRDSDGDEDAPGTA